MATEAGPSTLASLHEANGNGKEPRQEPHLEDPSSSKPPDKEDADTCRICRGESTADEPLFYPCKCSGSIKYVHQECLMEWLSHSQKKYCELCKTSFRFTKLYHPGMPNRIPTSVFIRRAAIHVFKMFMTWCRAVLVASVWLILLPWCMRVVWRSLFWVGDGGWSRDIYAEPAVGEQTSSPSAFDLEAVRSAVESARAANTSIDLPLPKFLMPFSQTLNMSAGEPTLWALVKRFFIDFSYPLYNPSTGLNNTNLNATTDLLRTRHPSLLSDISFFNWFPSQTANRFLIDVLEGQIITLLVVVAFILIFLIREWVVQQQPVINMVALEDDVAANRAHGHEGHEDEHEEDPAEEEEEREAGEQDQIDRGQVSPQGNDDEAIRRPGARPRRSSSAHRRRQAVFRMWQDSDEIPEELRRAMQSGSAEDVAKVVEEMPLEDSIKLKEQLIKLTERISAGSADIPGNAPEDSNEQMHSGGAQTEASNASSSAFPERSSSLPQESDRIQEGSRSELTNSPQRPNMPARDRSFIATEIRRSLEEGNSWSFANVPQPSEEVSEEVARKNIPDSWEDEADASNKDQEAGVSDQEQDSEHSSESWQQIPDIVIDDNFPQPVEGVASANKGKGKVSETLENSQDESLASPESELRLLDHAITEDAIRPDHALEADFASNQSDCGSDSYRQGSDIEDYSNPSEAVPESDQEQEPETGPEPVQAARPPPGLMDRILDWVFGDVAPATQAAEDAANDEHIVRNLADEAPFVPFAANEPREPANPPIQDPEVAAAAAQAGIDVNDQDAIDDAEDLEGIMELIGMQGPLTGLFQNAMFSAVLISATLACAVWLPYLWGKLVILIMGSPFSLFIKFPLQFIATVTDFVVDTALCVAAGAVFWTLQFVQAIVRICTWGTLSGLFENPVNAIAVPARAIAENALDRLSKLVLESSLLPRPDSLRFSINSHVALRNLQNSTHYALNQTGNVIAAFYDNMSSESAFRTTLRILGQVPNWLRVIWTSVVAESTALTSWIWTSKSYKITFDLDGGRNTTTTHVTLEQWSATDRLIAIFAGYAFFAMVGAIYLKRGSPFSTSQQGRKIERIISDILQQAGGVLKVILIISIEMLAFPLYCGLLLDLALLPLFKDASLYTRWQFTRDSPWTSGFVHWFIGTCYMFHFALFVSMCRKIMRKGVLYFIRDPDDPTFHPVRDVLERSVTTQLRKIAFSALVYGALVIVCLGGVVWGLDRLTTGVLPIHWTSQAPSLEFPLDLLFYNFLTPVIIKLYKPSDGLHAVTEWWFRRCAKFLRLSNFLFGGKYKEEEGHHVRRTWSSWLTGAKGDPEQPVIGEDRKILAEDRGTRVYFMFDGRYVRAPGSDQARIPKGEPVFVEVDQYNNRKDGKSEAGGVHNSELVTMVYIPPWFRLRIALFVFTIWIFAAVVGISLTIVPLLFGRYLFSLLLPTTVEMNDIHAFSLGIYTLGTILYSNYQLYKFVSSLNRQVPPPLSTLQNIAATTSRIGLRVLRFSYVWTSLIFIIPFLFAVLIELYFLMPLHAYLGPSEPHVVHLIQDWTLGFLYARLAARVVFSDRSSRPARAFSAIVANGYLNPNAWIATRCFLFPVVAVFGIAIVFPSTFAFVVNRTIYYAASETTQSQVWRFSYPSIGLSLVAMWAGREAVGMLNRWRMIVRDEVYLIGERLHNFGERRAPQVPATNSNTVTA